MHMHVRVCIHSAIALPGSVKLANNRHTARMEKRRHAHACCSALLQQLLAWERGTPAVARRCCKGSSSSVPTGLYKCTMLLETAAEQSSSRRCRSMRSAGCQRARERDYQEQLVVRACVSASASVCAKRHVKQASGMHALSPTHPLSRGPDTRHAWCLFMRARVRGTYAHQQRGRQRRRGVRGTRS